MNNPFYTGCMLHAPKHCRPYWSTTLTSLQRQHKHITHTSVASSISPSSSPPPPKSLSPPPSISPYNHDTESKVEAIPHAQRNKQTAWPVVEKWVWFKDWYFDLLFSFSQVHDCRSSRTYSHVETRLSAFQQAMHSRSRKGAFKIPAVFVLPSTAAAHAQSLDKVQCHVGHAYHASYCYWHYI